MNISLIVPIGEVREVAKELKHVELKGTAHFYPYTGPVFEQVVARQTGFFVAHS